MQQSFTKCIQQHAIKLNKDSKLLSEIKELLIHKWPQFLTINNLNKSIDLTFDQQKALNNIKKELDEKRVVLFKGVTSSGKTEIYIELIKEEVNVVIN